MSDNCLKRFEKTDIYRVEGRTSADRRGVKKALRLLAFLSAGVFLFFGRTAGKDVLAEELQKEPEAKEAPELSFPGSLPDAESILQEKNAGLVPEGLSVDGISLAGMTAEEARRFVIDRGRSGEKRSLSFVFPGDTVPCDPAIVSLGWTDPHAFDSFYHRLQGGAAEWLSLKNELEASPVDIKISYGMNTEAMADAFNAALASHSRAMVNPSLSRADGQFVVAEGCTGITYDADPIFADIVGKLSVWAEEGALNYEVPQTVIPQEYPASVFSFSAQPIGSYTTTGLGSDGRRQSIARSAELMNGHVFLPGAQISTLSMYGAVTQENGYGIAGGFEMGKVVDVVGGGVCQTTTTLYNAVLRAELGIVFRKHHSMLVSYVPPAMDATVVPAEGSDFVFANTTNHAIYIESYVHDDSITVNIWGCEERPANRSISFTTDVLALQFPDNLYVQIVDDNVCHYGKDWVWNKIYPDANPHPYCHAVSYKHVFVDGVETEVTLLNDDAYSMSSGVIYRASDCRVNTTLIESTAPDAIYPYLGTGVYVHVMDVWGNPWPGM